MDDQGERELLKDDDQVTIPSNNEDETMQRIHECYKYLEDFARRRNMSVNVLQAIHRQAGDLLKGLK